MGSPWTATLGIWNHPLDLHLGMAKGLDPPGCLQATQEAALATEAKVAGKVLAEVLLETG
jgi:hypothetical protein